ncbi:YdcF family protein [Occallatibacter riparius]|uniref:YdcF family protein n=1 Tax=Occallatibacter riparius TaxID=1002689 RepID=A0A9J7BTH0_9BACT|nr:YdcF family protein [Occallatibacter riparius]UWZ85944.1 YdcF family protein [Occallatibacter riparius]
MPRHSAASRTKTRLSARTRLILAGAGVGSVLLLWAILARVFAPAGNTNAGRVDAIIVLGAKIDSDGTPSPALLSRVTEGVREYERGVAPRIIVTGGKTSAYTEADVMARLARAQGVPDSAIVKEPQAENTIQNACYSARIMKQHGWKSAEVVTSPSHLPRAGIVFSHTPLEWRGHVAPSLDSPAEGPSWIASASEVLHTGYYLLYSRWADRCSP